VPTETDDHSHPARERSIPAGVMAALLAPLLLLTGCGSGDLFLSSQTGKTYEAAESAATRAGFGTSTA
jgi:Flp pilus assembly protein TadG